METEKITSIIGVNSVSLHHSRAISALQTPRNFLSPPLTMTQSTTHYLNDIRCPDSPKPSGLWAVSVSSELLWGEIGQLTYKCSRKKSKCTGERPICSFCERLQLPCKYAARGSSSQDSTTKAQKAQKSDASIIHFHILCLTEVVGNPPMTGSRFLNRK